MNFVLFLALALLQGGAQDSFSVRAELQGLYDETSQATLQFETESDVDQFHDVLCAPDWVFVDAMGQRHSWRQLREQAVESLTTRPFDSMIQAIQKLSLGPAGATVVVDVTTVHAIVDNEGRYGRKGGSHTLTETIVFRDAWIRISDEWKQKLREQIGAPKVWIDKPALAAYDELMGHAVGR
jgi:hypothetical protein